MPKVKSKQKQKQRQSVVVNVNTKQARRLSNPIRPKPQAPPVSYGGMSFSPSITAPQSSIAELLQILKLSKNQQQELTRDVLLPTPTPALPRATTIEKTLNPALHSISEPLRSIEEGEKKVVEDVENPFVGSDLQPNSPEDPVNAPLREENLTPYFVSPLKREEPITEDEIHYRENPLSPRVIRPQRDISTDTKVHAFLAKNELPRELFAEPAKASKFYRSAEAKAIVEKTKPRGRPPSEELLKARQDVTEHNLSSDNPIDTSYPNGKTKSLQQLRRELGTRF